MSTFEKSAQTVSNFEVDRLTFVDADAGREALNRIVGRRR